MSVSYAMIQTPSNTREVPLRNQSASALRKQPEA